MKPNNSWEIKFNKEFRHWFEDYLNENLDEDCKERLKDFITKTLQQQREEETEKTINKYFNEIYTMGRRDGELKKYNIVIARLEFDARRDFDKDVTKLQNLKQENK